jgi:hypothetical protein
MVKIQAIKPYDKLKVFHLCKTFLVL